MIQKIAFFSLFTLLTIVNAQNSMDLIPIWERVGDSKGAVNEEHKSASVEAAEFSPDETLIGAGAKRGGDVNCWTIKGEKLWNRKHKADPENEVEVITWTRDSRFVLSGGENFRVNVWRASDGKKVNALIHNASIDGMRMSHDGSILAAGTEAGEIVLWDTSSPNPAMWPDEPLTVLYQGPDENRQNGGNGHSDVNSIDWTEDDRFIVTAGRNALVKRWEIARVHEEDQGLVQSYEGFSSSIKTARISPDRKYIAAGGQDSPDAALFVWDYKTGEILAHINVPHFNKIEAVEFTPDGRFLITGGNEGTGYNSKDDRPEYLYLQGFGAIRVYSVEKNFALVHEEHTYRQEYFQFNSDGSRLLSSHEDGTLRLWTTRYIEQTANVFANIFINSEKYYYHYKKLQPDAKLYRDAEYVITEVPDYLENQWYIQTDLTDNIVANPSFLDFDLRLKSTLYVAFDPQAVMLPKWLQDWTPVDDEIKINVPSEVNEVTSLKLYANVFPAGHVTLGGNQAPPSQNVPMNYIVIGREGEHLNGVD